MSDVIGPDDNPRPTENQTHKVPWNFGGQKMMTRNGWKQCRERIGALNDANVGEMKGSRSAAHSSNRTLENLATGIGLDDTVRGVVT